MNTLVVADTTRWGPWQYDPETPALYMRHPLNQATEYWIPLPKTVDHHTCQHWRRHLAAKTWASHEVLQGLIAALADLSRVTAS
jgi:hypothetical protein